MDNDAFDWFSDNTEIEKFGFKAFDAFDLVKPGEVLGTLRRNFLRNMV